MANTFKNAAAAVGTSRTDIYTCPGATAAVIHSVYLSNVDGVSSVDAMDAGTCVDTDAESLTAEAATCFGI